MKHFLILSFCFFYLSSIGQSSLNDMLWSKKTFDEIVADGENYFREKHPNTNFRDLTRGDNRDSEFVKFMRWQSYWKNSLNADGTLADVSKFIREAQLDKNTQQRASSPFQNVDWTNLSYVDYITSQIGLGRTTSIGFHPTDANTFYVGAAIGGIWRTTDGGQSYIPLGDDLPWMAVSSIVVNKSNPSHIYIGISDHVWYGPPGIGVYVSTDAGANWAPTSLNFELADNIRIYWIEPDPNNPSKMFVATSDGLYMTSNAFDTVTKVSTVNCFDVKVNPGNSNIVYMGGNNGEFQRSIDGGINFSQVVDFGGGNVYAAVTAQNPSKVYARNGNTLHKSTDNGVSFPNTSAMPVPNSVLTFAPSNESILLAGNFETDRSDDDGASFYKTSQWLGLNGLPLIHVDQRNIFTNPLQTDYVYYCNDGGVYRYIISTNSFDNLCNGLQITQFYDIAVSQTDKNVLGGGSQDNGNVFRESNGVWDDYAPTGDGMNQEIDPTNANVRYWAYQNGDIHRWENGTNTYISPFSKTGAWETPYKLDPNNSDRLVAGYDKVYSSLDRGDTWVDISGSTNFGGDLNEIAIAKSNSNRIYASRANQLYVKNVADNNWTNRPMPGTAADLEVDPLDMDHIYIVTPGYTAGQKVYESTDAGINWTNISGSLPNISVDALELYETIEGGIFIGTDIGVYYKDVNQADWQIYGDLPNTRVDDIEIQYAEKLIRVGTHGRGLLEASIIIDEYCAAAGSGGTGSDYINRVELNTINNTSGQTAYSDFTSMSTDVIAGASYPIEVQLHYSFPLDAVYVWIDYNKDGVFEASEQIAMSDPLDDVFNSISSGIVTIPPDALLGETTMRVRNIYADPNSPDPCGNYFGEVEDYTVNIKYCAAAGSAGTGSDYINRVELNTINNTSGQSFYSDFTSMSTDLIPGASYPIEVQLQYSFPLDAVYVWIDFNNNGVFEASEQIVMSDPPDDVFDGISSGIVTVPADAILGETIMRIRNIYADPNNPDPCGNYFGEVEDYTVNLIYCAGSGFTSSDHITNVTLNTIDNDTGSDGYSYYSATPLPILNTNRDYNIDVTASSAFAGDIVYVWIDYDQNGVFTSTERTDLPFNGSNTFSGNISITSAVPLGATTMRIRFAYGTAPDPCNIYDGEIEDYALVIEELDPCEEDITLVSPNDDIPGAAFFIATNKSIYATNKITGASAVDFSAGTINGEEISLDEGFEVGLGAVFHAYMEGCVILARE